MLAEKTEQLLAFHHATRKTDIQQTHHIFHRQVLHPIGKLVERPGHIRASYNGAHRGTGHNLGLYAHFFQCLNDPDVRPAPG